MSNTFKEKHTLEQRQSESNKIIKKYDDRIPIIVTKDPKCKRFEDMVRINFRHLLI